VLYIICLPFSGSGFCIIIFAKLAVSICVALAPRAGVPAVQLLALAVRRVAQADGQHILLMVVMAIMTKFITGLQEASMDGIIGAIGDGSNFIQTEGTFSELNTGMMIVATISCCAIYIVGTIFFFQSPSIASGIAGGASSGGHAFLQTGMNLAANRLMFRRLTGASAQWRCHATGGSVSRSTGTSG
jgi:type IV secretion system protein VirB6